MKSVFDWVWLIPTLSLFLLIGCSSYMGSMKADPATGSVAGYEAGVCFNFPDMVEYIKKDLKGMKGCVDAKAEVHISPK